MNDQKKNETEWVVEYFGPFKNLKLHWYARALLRGGKVYLVTATSSEQEWPEVQEKLRAVVDSLELQK